MEGILSIFQNITNLNTNDLDIYLQGYSEQQSFYCDRTTGKNIIQTINSLLIKANTRKLAIHLLNEFLKQCSNEVFEEHANHWTTYTLKAFHSNEINKSEIFEVLDKIATRGKQTSDFSKSFPQTHLSKIYESINQLSTAEHTYAALECIISYLRAYPGPSGAAKTSLDRFLWQHIDSTDEYLCQLCAKCHLLLLQVRGGGIQNTTYRNQWQTYQTKLLGSIHGYFKEIFMKVREVYDCEVETEQLELPELKLSDEPTKRQVQLYIRLHNLIMCLQVALSEPFPSEKPIKPKRILNVINRGLSVTKNVINQNPISDNLALCLLLPKIHVNLLNLLETLCLILNSHLKLFHNIVLEILIDELKWTSTQSANNNKPYVKLRIKVYKIIVLWCGLMQYGSCIENIAEHLVREIILDVQPVNNECLLKVKNTKEKNVSKKSKKQTFKTQNMESNMAQTQYNKKDASHTSINNNNQLLCVEALKCLQCVLLSSSSFLKPNTTNLLQKKILQIGLNLYDLPSNTEDLYDNWLCRKEILNVLYTMQLTANPLCPPPTNLIFNIITKAFQLERIQKLRLHSGELLLQLEKLVHPQKESLLYPINLNILRSELVIKNNHIDQYNILNEETTKNLSELDNNDEKDENNSEMDENDSEDENNDENDNVDEFDVENNVDQDQPSEKYEKSIQEKKKKHIDIISHEILTTKCEINSGKTSDASKIDESKHREELSPPVPKRSKYDESNYVTDQTEIDKEKENLPTVNDDKTNIITNTENIQTDNDALLADLEAEFVDELI